MQKPFGWRYERVSESESERCVCVCVKKDETSGYRNGIGECGVERFN